MVRRFFIDSGRCDFRFYDSKQKKTRNNNFGSLVGVTGFEPAASWSRTKRSTELSHTPQYFVFCFRNVCIISYRNGFVKGYFQKK